MQVYWTNCVQLYKADGEIHDSGVRVMTLSTSCCPVSLRQHQTNSNLFNPDGICISCGFHNCGGFCTSCLCWRVCTNGVM